MAIYSAIGPLSSWLVRRFPALATTTERIGRAMIHVAAKGYRAGALESQDINAAAG
jgi:hypothetical protein